MTKPKKAKNRVGVDITDIEDEILTYPDRPDATKTWKEWADMTRPEKLLHLATEGLNAAGEALDSDE